MFKKLILENGLRIITAPMQGTNTVTVLVLCGTGSDHEKRDERGISHVLEHMFFKGTQKRPEAGTVHRELDEMGSIHNAFTSHETTGYYVKAGKGQFLRALDILADIYNKALLREEELDKERLVIVEEMRMHRDTPMEHIGDLWERLLYGDEPQGWEIIGEEKTVRSLHHQDLTDYFFHQYTAPNTAVVVAGNFQEQYATESVRSFFKDARSASPVRGRPPVEEKQSSPAVSAHYKETDQTHFMLGFRGFGAGHPQRYVAEILSVILGGIASSRMFTRIREELGLAYAIATDFHPYSNRGYLVTYAGVDHANAKKAIGAMLEVYKRACFERVVPAELQKVKEYIRGTTLIGFEQSNAVAGFVGAEEMLSGKPLTTDELFAKIDAVTPEDLLAVAKEIMRPERLNLAVIGPFRDSTDLQKIITDF